LATRIRKILHEQTGFSRLNKAHEFFRTLIDGLWESEAPILMIPTTGLSQGDELVATAAGRAQTKAAR
jgi:hypothetical protein